MHNDNTDTEDFEIVDSKELREEALLQLLAVLIHRMGGEVLISVREFGMVEGAEIRARHVTSEHLRLSLDEEFYPDDEYDGYMDIDS